MHTLHVLFCTVYTWDDLMFWKFGPGVSDTLVRLYREHLWTLVMCAQDVCWFLPAPKSPLLCIPTRTVIILSIVIHLFELSVLSSKCMFLVTALFDLRWERPPGRYCMFKLTVVWHLESPPPWRKGLYFLFSWKWDLDLNRTCLIK